MAATSKSPVPRPAQVEWFYVHEGEQVGPVTEEGLISAARERAIRPDTLVWQKAYDRWKHAANVPMIAVNMGYPISSIRLERAPLPRRPEPMKESPPEPPADESFILQDLDDDVTDDEAAEPVVDVEQALEILGRASLPPPDRSIPPAGYVSIQAADQAQARKPLGNLLLVALTAGVLLAGTAIVMLTAREPQAQQEPKAAAVADVSNDTRQSRRVVEPVAAQEPAPPATGAAEAQAAPVVITKGTLNVELVQIKLSHGLPMYDDQCWDRLRAPVGEVADNPSVRIEMSVDRLGNVYDLVSSESPPGYLGAGRCIVGRMRGWKFPRAEEGSHAVITVARYRK